MKSKQEAEIILRNRGWLTQMPAPVQQDIVQRLVLKEYRARDIVFRQNDEIGGMYGVVEGTLCVSLAPSKRGPYSASFIRVGSWIGGGPAITDKHRIVSASVRSNTLLVHLPAVAIRELTSNDPTFWRYLAINVFNNLELALKRFDDLLIADPRVRVAATLLRLGGFDGDPVDPFANHEIPMTQSEIAELTLLTRNGLAGVLSRLRGMVAVSYGRVTLSDPKRLMQLVENWQNE